MFLKLFVILLGNIIDGFFSRYYVCEENKINETSYNFSKPFSLFSSGHPVLRDSRDPRELSLARGWKLVLTADDGQLTVARGGKTAGIEARQWSTAESTTSVCSMNLLEFSKRSGERVVYFLLVGDNEDMAAVWLKRDMYAREIQNVKFTTNFLTNVFLVFFTRNISQWLISLFMHSLPCRLLLSYRATTNQPTKIPRGVTAYRYTIVMIILPMEKFIARSRRTNRAT